MNKNAAAPIELITIAFFQLSIFSPGTALS
jgi:hypothetical protein